MVVNGSKREDFCSTSFASTEILVCSETKIRVDTPAIFLDSIAISLGKWVAESKTFGFFVADNLLVSVNFSKIEILLVASTYRTNYFHIDWDY